MFRASLMPMLALLCSSVGPNRFAGGAISGYLGVGEKWDLLSTSSHKRGGNCFVGQPFIIGQVLYKIASKIIICIVSYYSIDQYNYI